MVTVYIENMPRRIDHATAAKMSAALAARAAFGEPFAFHSAQLAGLLPALVESVFSRPAWETRERHGVPGAATERRIAGDRS